MIVKNNMMNPNPEYKSDLNIRASKKKIIPATINWLKKYGLESIEILTRTNRKNIGLPRAMTSLANSLSHSLFIDRVIE